MKILDNPKVPELTTELDRAAVDLFIERHGREAYDRGEIGETLERIDQKTEEYDPVFLSKHPELKGESITVYHDPLRGEDLAVINTQTGEVIEVLSDELRGRLVKPPAVKEARAGDSSSNPGDKAQRKAPHERIVNDLLPMAPDQGPPLPRGLGVHWSWKK